MPSFKTVLQVAGKQYEIRYSEFSLWQMIDELGRPASPTLGGGLVLDIEEPPEGDSLLYEWMFSPVMQLNGQVVVWDLEGKMLKVIKFHHAFLVNMRNLFDGSGQRAGEPSKQMQLTISPQAVDNNGQMHDNNWPAPDPIVDWNWSDMNEQCNPDAKKKKEPSALSEGLHTLLDVVGMIPVVGELADGANALVYAAEGDYVNAAMSAAAMIPLAGNVVGAAKLAKRGMKLVQKAKKLVPPRLIKQIDKVATAGKELCTKVGHPIDVATGLLFTEATDIRLPGTIPFIWERTFYSASDYNGPLGYGWHHGYDMGLALDADTDTAVLRMADGRQVAFGAPAQLGQSVLDLSSGLSLQRAAGNMAAPDAPTPWLVWDRARRLWFVFAPPVAGGAYQPLHTIENETGQFIGFQYTTDRRLASITDSAGRLLPVTYNEQGFLAGIDGPDPNEAGATISLVRYAYDEAGRLVRITDAEDYATSFAYQGSQMVRETNAEGLSFYFAYEETAPPGLPARCVHTWGDGGIFDTKLDYTDTRTTLVLDSYDQPTRYRHQNGVVVEQTDAMDQVQRWTYSPTNQLLSQTDSLGQITKYIYDGRGNLIQTTFADGTSQRINYDANDQPVSFIDGRGSRWQYAYTEQTLLSQQTDPLGATTQYTYDEQGQLTSLTNALGQTIKLRYDERGQLAHAVTPGGSAGEEMIRSRSYDGLGRLVKLTDPTGAVQLRQYNKLGQLIQVLEPDGSEQTLLYDGLGNVIEARQGKQVTSFNYSGQSLLMGRRQAGAEVEFTYDLEGRLTGLINEAGLAYRFGLDALGQVIEEEGFDGLLRRYERDGAGRVSRVVRPADRYTDYGYTPLGQVTSVAYSDGTKEDFIYDAVGQLSEARNETGSVRLERDALGRVVREEQNDAWVAYQYDVLGQRTAVSSSLGADITLSRDALGNLTGLSSQSWQAQFGYDQRGLEVQRSLSGGVQLGWQRDSLGRPTQQRFTADGSNSPVRQRDYVWGGSDQLALIEDSQTGSCHYEYDALGSLRGAVYADGRQELRLPDMVGNLFENVGRGDRQYGAGGQLLNSSHGRYDYDAEGNLTRKTTPKGDVWQYMWSGNGMLDSVTRPDGAEVTFAYDALGRRVSKSYKGKSTHWVWDSNKPLHEWSELSLDGQNTEAVITWLFEEDSFAPVARLQGTSRQSILTDHLGTPLEMVNQSGQTSWSAQTSSYGRIRMEEGTRNACPFRFQGQYEDTETGLYYNRFRYYTPEEGVYISQDPVRLLGGLASYQYVDDTNTSMDVYGLATCRLSAADNATLGNAPSGMTNPHRHHIVREGFPPKWDAVSQKHITDAQAIMQKHGIDVNTDLRNFTWAQNGAGAHTKKAAKNVFDRISAADLLGGLPEVEKTLVQVGQEMTRGVFF